MSAAPVGCLDEREAFEAWIVAEGYDHKHWLQRWRIGDQANRDRYMKDWVQTAWEAWQRRAALSASRQEGATANRLLIDALDRYLRQDETAADIDNGVYRQGVEAMKVALAAAPHQAQEAQGDRHGE